MSEALAYTLKPAGYDAPAEKRIYPEPDCSLAKAYETWLKLMNREYASGTAHLHYAYAIKLTKGLRTSVDEAHSLLVRYQDHPFAEHAGLFVSALYNHHIPDKEIVFDLNLEKPTDWLGYKLRKDKVFVNKGKTGTLLGTEARGIIINCGEAGRDMGWWSNCSLINYGEVGRCVGWGCGARIYDNSYSPIIVNCGKACHDFGGNTSVPILNFGEAHSIGDAAHGLVANSGKVSHRSYRDADGCIITQSPVKMSTKFEGKLIGLEDCKQMPELVAYLDSLKQKFETGRNDYRTALAALDGLGPLPGNKIESDVKTILKRAGYEV